jgi:MFS family permease
MSRATRLSRAQRHALRKSQREAVGSSVMTGVCDNYLGAFALFLNASAQQIGWVVALPQLVGPWAQLISVWLARRGARRIVLILAGASFQSLTIAVLIGLCVENFSQAVVILVITAVLFQAGGHLVQPQWRALMVLLVPVERRGRYFARRSRIIMVSTAFLIPLLPLLWIVSDNFWYLFAVQSLAGLAWGGFTLSATNYLYDLRPAGSELAGFAAVQAVASGFAIFCGAVFGGFLADGLPTVINLTGVSITFTNTLYGVFAISAGLRLCIALWFAPRLVEIRLSADATVNQLIYRLARFNPITGTVMDILGSVSRRR